MGELTFCKTMGVAVHSMSDIYSLLTTINYSDIYSLVVSIAKLSVMELYKAIHMVSYSTYALRKYLDNQCSGSKLECNSFFKFKNIFSKLLKLYFINISHSLFEINFLNQKTVE